MISAPSSVHSSQVIWLVIVIGYKLSDSTLYQDAFNTASICLRDILGQPVGTQQMPRHLDHDVIGIGVGVVIVTRQPLQARWARGEDFHVAGETVGTQFVRPFLHLFFLAE